MRQLTFVGLTDDGARLVLSAPDGQRYSVPIDQRLSVAVRRDRSRLGQLEIEMDGGIRPKDIQARIRAGMSAEEIAAAAGVPVESVRRFEGAVLDERAFVAEKASGTTVRTPTGSGPLAEVVSERLASRGVDPSTMRWDSWRRDDGRWVVMLAYGAGGGEEQSATWLYDVVARAVVPGDEEARWLIEDRQTVVVPHEPDPTSAGPRLVAVPTHVDEETDVDEVVVVEVEVEEVVVEVEQRAPARGVDQLFDQDDATPEPEQPAPAPEPEAAPQRPARTGRGKRTPVPSWDEILFGNKKSD